MCGEHRIGKRKLIVAWRKYASHSYNPMLTFSTQRIAQTKKKNYPYHLNQITTFPGEWWINKDGSFLIVIIYLFMSVFYTLKKGTLFFQILCHYGISLWHVATYSLSFILGSFPNVVRFHEQAVPNLQYNERQNCAASSHCLLLVDYAHFETDGSSLSLNAWINLIFIHVSLSDYQMPLKSLSQW